LKQKEKRTRNKREPRQKDYKNFAAELDKHHPVEQSSLPLKEDSV